MLQNSSGILGKPVVASDGLVGTVAALIFDDVTLTLRWVEVLGASQRPWRSVLLPAEILKRRNPDSPGLSVRLTIQQIQNGAELETGWRSAEKYTGVTDPPNFNDEGQSGPGRNKPQSAGPDRREVRAADLKPEKSGNSTARENAGGPSVVQFKRLDKAHAGGTGNTCIERAIERSARQTFAFDPG